MNIIIPGNRLDNQCKYRHIQHLCQAGVFLIRKYYSEDRVLNLCDGYLLEEILYGLN